MDKRTAFLRLAGLSLLSAFCAQASATEASYHCSDGTKLTAKFSPPGSEPGQVILLFQAGQEITLPQKISADGGRYANAEIEFWIKGQNATLTRKGKSETCSTK